MAGANHRRSNTWHFVCLLLALIIGLGSAQEDFYELLNVGRDAETSAIKKAFRKASLEYHPDKNPGKGHQTTSLLLI